MDGALSVVPWTVPFQWSRFVFEKATNNQVICGASVRLIAKAPAQVFRLREKRISPSTTREARNLPIFSLEFVEGVNCGLLVLLPASLLLGNPYPKKKEIAYPQGIEKPG